MARQSGAVVDRVGLLKLDARCARSYDHPLILIQVCDAIRMLQFRLQLICRGREAYEALISIDAS